MSDSGRSLNVLQKILNNGKKTENKSDNKENSSELIEKYLRPKTEGAFKTQKRNPGRPKVSDEKKAKNFTLCLAPKYLEFLDTMKVKDPKIQGRGRKIRFIIDQFLDLHKRQRAQLQVLKDSLIQVEEVLRSFSNHTQKNQKLELTNLEKKKVNEAVKQVRILLKVLCYSPKDLHKILPRNDWALVSFCLDWAKKENL